MTEQEIEELLGAYALDAVDATERAEIEAHLVICPRCRAEVTKHWEVAALLANGGAAAPEGLWDRISGELSPERPEFARESKQLIARLPASAHRRRRPSRAFVGAMFAAAAVTLVIALLSVQVANLNQQVHSNGSANGVSSAVNSVLTHQHRTIVLTSADGKRVATVVASPNGAAYWVNSDLKKLPTSKTYQLWTVVRGSTVVSLGVLGPNPNGALEFRLEPDMSRLMVTVEPQGGTPTPTSPVLIGGIV